MSQKILTNKYHDKEAFQGAVSFKHGQSSMFSTHSVKPFHLSRYSTLPFTTLRSRTFSTTYSSSSSSNTSSTFFLVCFFPPVDASLAAACAGSRR